MKIIAYNAKWLSNENNWPDNVHYETVRDRISKEKHIEIVFFTRHKEPQERSVFLPYDVSQRIIKAMEFYDEFLQWKFKIVKPKKSEDKKEKAVEKEAVNNNF